MCGTGEKDGQYRASVEQPLFSSTSRQNDTAKDNRVSDGKLGVALGVAAFDSGRLSASRWQGWRHAASRKLPIRMRAPSSGLALRTLISRRDAAGDEAAWIGIRMIAEVKLPVPLPVPVVLRVGVQSSTCVGMRSCDLALRLMGCRRELFPRESVNTSHDHRSCLCAMPSHFSILFIRTRTSFDYLIRHLSPLGHDLSHRNCHSRSHSHSQFAFTPGPCSALQDSGQRRATTHGNAHPLGFWSHYGHLA